MSWFTEIAGKAENFLNAVDKGAASAITNVVQKASSSSTNNSGGVLSVERLSRKNSSDTTPSLPSRKYSFRSDFGDYHSGSSTFANDVEYIETPDIMSLKTSTSTNSLVSSNGNGNNANGGGGGNGHSFVGGGHGHGHKRTSSYDSVGSRGSASATKKQPAINEDRLMEYLNNENDNGEDIWVSGGGNGGNVRTKEESDHLSLEGDTSLISHIDKSDASSDSHLSQSTADDNEIQLDTSTKAHGTTSEDDKQQQQQQDLSTTMASTTTPTTTKKSLNRDPRDSKAAKQAHVAMVKIETLTKELTALQRRYTDLMHEYKQLQRKTSTYHNQNLSNERFIRELRSRDQDLMATLEAKDSQIAALKVQLEQFSDDLRSRTQKLARLEEVNRELLEAQAEDAQHRSTLVDQTVVATLEEEIVNLKQSLAQERDTLRRAHETHRETIDRLEDSQRSLISELENCRRTLAEVRKQEAELKFDQTQAQKRFETLEQEFAEYKVKAAKTLQDKDELIRSFQVTTAVVDEAQLQQQASDTTATGINDHQQAGETIRLLQEQSDRLLTELRELESKYEQAKSIADRAENEVIPKQQYEIRTLTQALEVERTAVSQLQADVRQLTEESLQYQDDLTSIRSQLSARLAERDEEIEKLRKQLILNKPTSVQTSMIDDADSGGGGGGHRLQTSATLQQSPSQSNLQQTSSLATTQASSEEWETRLQTLTESLIQKQATVEQLNSANHSLKLQLERLEQRLREISNGGGGGGGGGGHSFSSTSPGSGGASNFHNNDVAIGIYHSSTFTNYIKHRMNVTGGGSIDQIPLLEEDPSDGQVTRKVKRAYGAIDAFSIRLGNFLRLYPSARAVFLVYIIILHLWVAFVLIYYEPEIHSNTDFAPNVGVTNGGGGGGGGGGGSSNVFKSGNHH